MSLSAQSWQYREGRKPEDGIEECLYIKSNVKSVFIFAKFARVKAWIIYGKRSRQNSAFTAHEQNRHHNLFRCRKLLYMLRRFVLSVTMCNHAKMMRTQSQRRTSSDE